MYFRAPFYSTRGVVASEHSLASVVGMNVLRRGGNAVDACVATSFTLSVVLPHLSGLGGDFFAILRDPDGKIYVVNGSGWSPRRLTIDYMRELGFKSMPTHDVYSITIPGLVDGLYGLWRRFGSLDWSELVRPAIKIAGGGFPASRSLCRAIRVLSGKLIRDCGSRITYLGNGVPSEGDIIAFKGLAEALKLIADDARNFYEGDIAVKIVDYLKSLDGVMDLDDFRSYHHEFQEPIKIDYRGRTVYEMPPNSQGVTTLHLIKLLEDFDFSGIDSKSIDRIKLFIEAAKIAYHVRDKFVSDPKFIAVTVDDLLSHKFIDNMKKMEVKDLNNASSGNGDTTFYAIADGEGWLLSCIQSIFHNFGSYITEPTYNITLNCRAASFKLNDNHVNKLEPNKKPLHTLSAILLKDDSRWMAIGLSGGHYRPLLHVQLLNSIIDYGMHPQVAIEHPRFRWIPFSDKIEYELGYKGGSLSGFKLKTLNYPSRMGVAAMVELREKLKAGYTDIRGDGMAIGLE
ncbi:MAG: gamma-glutamyltransferase [Candidatus Methanomethylicota archaeon]|nr:MAG: gamma-glutamyltransferase [Candidatus Verstraetearchaeota archaeon]